MKRRAFLAGMSAMASPARVNGQTPPQALAGDRFQWGDDVFILADIRAPSAFALGQETAIFSIEAKNILQDALLAIGKLNLEDVGRSRWGERIVFAVKNDRPLSGAVVARGGARVAPDTEDHDAIGLLLRSENEARANRRGLWAHKVYQLTDAARAENVVGAFHIVTGSVQRVHATRPRTYLNFGEDYRTDFTITISAKTLKKWPVLTAALDDLTGRRVRARGFVRWINGPSIEILHPMALEILDASSD